MKPWSLLFEGWQNISSFFGFEDIEQFQNFPFDVNVQVISAEQKKSQTNALVKLSFSVVGFLWLSISHCHDGCSQLRRDLHMDNWPAAETKRRNRLLLLFVWRGFVCFSFAFCSSVCCFSSSNPDTMFYDSGAEPLKQQQQIINKDTVVESLGQKQCTPSLLRSSAARVQPVIVIKTASSENILLDLEEWWSMNEIYRATTQNETNLVLIYRQLELPALLTLTPNVCTSCQRTDR